VGADRDRFDVEAAARRRTPGPCGWARDPALDRAGPPDAFTFNFMDMERSRGHATAPFLEASKAMARGVGYAGEGDVLTAMFVAAISAGHRHHVQRDVLPDWETGAVYLSHMGEVNCGWCKAGPGSGR